MTSTSGLTIQVVPVSNLRSAFRSGCNNRIASARQRIAHSEMRSICATATRKPRWGGALWPNWRNAEGEDLMIVEMRTYTLAVGATGRYFKLYGEKGLAVQKRILGHLVGYYGVEVGGLNQVIHLWAYDTLEDRATRRAKLWADKAWLAYVAEVGPLVLKQENQLLSPAPFFQIPDAA